MIGGTPPPNMWALDHPASARTSRKRTKVIVGTLAVGLLLASASPAAARIKSPLSGYGKIHKPLSGYVQVK